MSAEDNLPEIAATLSCSRTVISVGCRCECVRGPTLERADTGCIFRYEVICLLMGVMCVLRFGPCIREVYQAGRKKVA